jgi:hypothetical protein
MLGKEAITQMVARRLLPDSVWDQLLIKGLNKH